MHKCGTRTRPDVHHRAELMGAIERMEDLVRRNCIRRDDQGNTRTHADDIRMSSLEAWSLENF